MADHGNYIDGEWRPASGGALFDNRNPADTRELVGRFAASTAADGQAAVDAADRAFAAWSATPVGKRAQVLQKAADWLDARNAEFARELTREEGKPLALAQDEFTRAAQTLRFYAVEGQTFGGETFPQDDAGMVVYTQREPLGVISVISPWNFPVSIPARKIAPALVTGNTVVFKPSSDAPLSGLRLVEALIAGGAPKGVVNFITGKPAEVGAALTSAQVRGITFTGSTSAGEQLHRAAGLTTRTQMELGGKNPLLVMEDADLDLAVDLAVKGGLSLTGQACTGTSRVLVAKDLRSAFVEKLVERVRRMKIGNGLELGVELGPIATAKQYDTVLSYVEIGRGEAKHVHGGNALNKREGLEHGYFVEPAVFTDVAPDARIAREEIFGPVLAVIDTEGFEDAMQKANDSPYGLSAAICTRNAKYAHEFCKRIQAGTVKVNRTTTGNLVNAPFGGYKQSSGSGFRESGRTGLEFFLQTKTVYRAF